MKSAYMYVRVSTDEQMCQGYSLIEQEERLLQYCEFNSIQITGIFREDYSAKDFNRPEWKKRIKRNSWGEENNFFLLHFKSNENFHFESSRANPD